jgi:hypothetical protein
MILYIFSGMGQGTSITYVTIETGHLQRGFTRKGEITQ